MADIRTLPKVKAELSELLNWATVDEGFPKRLKKLREDRGLNQRQLSFPGCSYAYISRTEADTRTPSVTALRGLAIRLRTTPGWLAWGIGERDVDADHPWVAQAYPLMNSEELANLYELVGEFYQAVVAINGVEELQAEL